MNEARLERLETIEATGRSGDLEAILTAFFRPAIEDSYRAESTFMKAIHLVRFDDRGSVAISNFNLIRATAETCEIQRLTGRDELVRAIEQEFRIPGAITRVALAALTRSPPS